jgi:putative flavoprotein involved in K+ transport
MDTTHTIVIGAGQAGLAASACLTERGHDHVVLERGRVAERWLSERWDSLRLLTPNWMTRLPGYRYTGREPDGFMTARETAQFFEGYAAACAAPVREHSDVVRLTRQDRGFVVTTTTGRLSARNVVIATGWCDRPAIPDAARCLAPRIHQVVPTTYKNPSDLPEGGVLVVGASATGVQLAAELREAGRTVVLAVGSHHRMPRQYRGLDSFWWLEQLGSFDRTVDDVDDPWAARFEPALQLAGRPDRTDVDLPFLQSLGVVLVGRLRGVDDTQAFFDPDVSATIAAADARLLHFRSRVDDLVERSGLSSEVLDPEPATTVRPLARVDGLDLVGMGIRTVVWATGYRRRYPWLELPVLDRRGEIAQRRGVTPVPGAYVLGQRFQHHRNSNFIDGVGRDAEYVADHIHARAAAGDPPPPSPRPPSHPRSTPQIGGRS